jgi:hypothetical protein
MSVIIDGTAGVTFNDASIQNTAATGFGFKNRIINGAMVIDQRNAGASVTITNTAANTFMTDRFFVYGSQASKFSAQQNAGAVTPPAGFTNYLGITSLSAYSITSSDVFVLGQNVEGFNAADLTWGTASAQTITLSFWVRSSLTGTFGGVVRNSANNRSYPFSYAISSANTWEQKAITIAGDTTGTWVTNNGVGLRIHWGLGVGSTTSGTAGAWSASEFNSATGATSVVGTNGATFYITGVQLEKGSTATSFDVRPYGTELNLCQRYTQVIRSNASGTTGLVNLACISSTRAYGEMPFEMQMRSSPIITFSAANTFQTRNNAGNSLTVTAITAASINIYSYDLDVSVASGLTAGDCTSTSMIAGTSGLITISAEL